MDFHFLQISRLSHYVQDEIQDLLNTKKRCPSKGKIEGNLFALPAFTILPDLSLRKATIKKATESYHIFSTSLMCSVKSRHFKNQESPLNSVLEAKVLVHDCVNMALSFFCPWYIIGIGISIIYLTWVLSCLYAAFCSGECIPKSHNG